jgi:hypothetical protein
MPNAGAQQQHPRTRREAVGSERATEVESILRALRPGTTVVWTPELGVRDSSGSVTPVDVHDIKTVPEGNGGRAGIVAIDLGSEKKQYVEHVKRGVPVTPEFIMSALCRSVIIVSSYWGLCAMRKLSSRVAI